MEPSLEFIRAQDGSSMRRLTIPKLGLVGLLEWRWPSIAHPTRTRTGRQMQNLQPIGVRQNRFLRSKLEELRFGH